MTLEQIFGKSIIIHEKPDNFGNIPADKYPGRREEDTLKTGDAGAASPAAWSRAGQGDAVEAARSHP